ncbi:YbjQ family protein [Demequina phytophila]|uniref:YbjQ family protein n=1 Tax=Demequina phytophila TaxID=1638981 RepID=UPI000780C87E|nr:heavy metal-binding domain-containing protein [Demequina phytophila]
MRRAFRHATLAEARAGPGSALDIANTSCDEFFQNSTRRALVSPCSSPAILVDVIITTTANVEGSVIVEYMRPIAVHIVEGTDFVSDAIAGFSDAFGGRSKTYEAALARMHATATAEVEARATAVGATGVVGLRYDLDSVSGKGMQIFVLNVTGTPVVLRTPDEVAAASADAKRREQARVDAEKERRERIAATGDSLADFLSDPALAAEAREVLRLYGRSVLVGFLARRRDELGLPPLELDVDSLPATI